MFTRSQPEKKLTKILPKNAGRDSAGHVSIRHVGGRHKRFYRTIDFRRDKIDTWGRVLTIEYDPNRTANIALIAYADGEKSYILAPLGLKVGDIIQSGNKAEIKIGNATYLKNLPLGTSIHSIEMVPGKGAKMLRAAGTTAVVLAKEGDTVQIKLPSGEIRKFSGDCIAVVGQVGNIEWRNTVLGKAGAARHRGLRPEVRGVAQDPRSHPHGGGEGRSGIGMPSPKSPWGKKTLGKKTRKKHKYSDQYIIQRRKKRKK